MIDLRGEKAVANGTHPKCFVKADICSALQAIWPAPMQSDWSSCELVA